MVWNVENKADAFRAGDKVTLGNGESAVVQKFVTSPTGFHSYIVEVTSGSRKGQQATTTAPAMQKAASSARVAVTVGPKTFMCRVASTPSAHAQGLQGVASLNAHEGMLFDFPQQRAATFHMGDVQFPIDIMFVENRRVARVIRNAQPGTRERWSHPRTEAVIEVTAGNAPGVGSLVLSEDEMSAFVLEAGDLLRNGTLEAARNILSDRLLQYWSSQPGSSLHQLVQDLVDEIMQRAGAGSMQQRQALYPDDFWLSPDGSPDGRDVYRLRDYGVHSHEEAASELLKKLGPDPNEKKEFGSNHELLRRGWIRGAVSANGIEVFLESQAEAAKERVVDKGLLDPEKIIYVDYTSSAGVGSVGYHPNGYLERFASKPSNLVSMPPNDGVEDASRAPTERFQSVNTPDAAYPSRNDAGSEWKQTEGYSPMLPEVEHPTRQADLTIEPAKFITGLLLLMSQQPRPLDWHRDALNTDQAYALLTPSRIKDLISKAQLPKAEATDVLTAASSAEGLRVLGDGLVLSGIADIARVKEHEDEGRVLVLFTSYDDVAK